MAKKNFPSAANNFNITPETFKNFTPEIFNYNTYWDYYKRLRLLALSVFEWINLPISTNERFLEKTLYEDGLACFVNDKTYGIMNTRCTPSAELNHYEQADEYKAYSIGYDQTYSLDDIVLIYNNYEAYPTDTTIQLFAYRLANVERIIDVNINAQRTPYIIKNSNTTKLTFKNLTKNVEDNVPFLFLDDEIDKFGEIGVLDTKAPYVADKLAAYKKNLWAEALSFLGINNVDTEKKSHLITAEVNSNNQLVSLSAETMLLTRKQACQEFNRKYNMNIDVQVRTKIDGNIYQEQGEYEDE